MKLGRVTCYPKPMKYGASTQKFLGVTKKIINSIPVWEVEMKIVTKCVPIKKKVKLQIQSMLLFFNYKESEFLDSD